MDVMRICPLWDSIQCAGVNGALSLSPPVIALFGHHISL